MSQKKGYPEYFDTKYFDKSVIPITTFLSVRPLVSISSTVCRDCNYKIIQSIFFPATLVYQHYLYLCLNKINTFNDIIVRNELYNGVKTLKQFLNSNYHHHYHHQLFSQKCTEAITTSLIPL